MDIDKANDMERFKQWLRDYTNKAESTIRLYVRTISRFLRRHNNITIEEINRFVSDSFRNVNSGYVKYSFYHYLKYIGKEKWYKHIVKVKQKPRKRTHAYIDKSEILEIIDNIQNQKHRDICKLQYLLSCRVREIITLREENIRIGPDKIDIMLITKRDQELHTALNIEHIGLITRNMRDKARYMFLSDTYNYADEPELITGIETMYKYVYNSLKKSSENLGYDFATHDFRRNVIDHFLKLNMDNIAQQVAGHKKRDTTLRYGNPDNLRAHKELMEFQKGC